MSAKRDLLSALRAEARNARSRFDIAHRKGMKALSDGDLNAFDEAVAEESAAMEAVDSAIKQILGDTGNWGAA